MKEKKRENYPSVCEREMAKTERINLHVEEREIETVRETELYLMEGRLAEIEKKI